MCLMARRARQTKRPGARRRRFSRKHLSRCPATLIVRDGVAYMRFPRRLRSLNNVRSDLSRFGDKKAWEGLFETMVTLEDDHSLRPGLKCRMRVEVQRLCPTKRYFLDRTNLHGGGIKQLEDCLTQLGWLVDDCETWEDGPYLSQALSEDAKYWTDIKITKAEARAQDNPDRIWPVDRDAGTNADAGQHPAVSRRSNLRGRSGGATRTSHPSRRPRTRSRNSAN